MRRETFSVLLIDTKLALNSGLLTNSMLFCISNLFSQTIQVQ